MTVVLIVVRVAMLVVDGRREQDETPSADSKVCRSKPKGRANAPALYPVPIHGGEVTYTLCIITYVARDCAFLAEALVC